MENDLEKEQQRPTSAAVDDMAGTNLGERIAYIEGQFKHIATKEDIANLRVWVLRGIIAFVISGALSVIAILSRFIWQ